MALTYASRTQHLTLARHISELVQRRAVEGGEEGEEEEEEEEEKEEGEEDAEYVQSRTEVLKRRAHLENGSVGGASSSKQAVPHLRMKKPKTVSKFDRYMAEIKQGKFLSHSHSTTVDARRRGGEGGGGGGGGSMNEAAAPNETRELFSDSEGEGKVEGEEGGGESGEEERGGSDGEGGRSPLHTPVQSSMEEAGAKRFNPFKVKQLARWSCDSHMTMHMMNTCSCYHSDVCMCSDDHS